MATPARLLIHPIRDVTIVNFNETTILDTVQVEQIGEQLYDLGEIGLAAELGEQLYDLVDKRDRKKLILDFSDVRLLSSSALGVLITLHGKAGKIKGRVILCGLRQELMKMFKITKLHKLFTFCDDEEQALAAFGLTTAG